MNRRSAAGSSVASTTAWTYCVAPAPPRVGASRSVRQTEFGMKW